MTENYPPESVFIGGVHTCPNCGHGIDTHSPTEMCGVGDENGLPCPCQWNPNSIVTALIAAMPQPIGYAVRVNGDGYLVASRSAEDAKSWAEAGYRPGAATPVALVPIARP